MKAYISISKFDVEDIITTSQAGGLENGGEGGVTGDIVIPDPISNIYD